MFQHILVPLDGSAPAEAALPAAVCLAQKLGAHLTLMHVIERDAPTTIHGARHLSRGDEAEAYLQDIRRERCPPSLIVACHVHETAEPDVARSIVEHEQVLAPDLIVLCAHGHSGLRGRLFGRIAEQVVAAGRVPVLMIRPPVEGPAPAFACEHMLVPVDGSPEHEESLCIAEGLALSTGATLELLFVVPTADLLAGPQAAASQLLPGATRAVLALEYEDARGYLQRQLDRMQQSRLKAIGQVVRGDPVPTIVQAAQQSGADFLVLATHGHTGMEVFWTGSTAPRVVAHTTLPLLLIPVHGSRPA